MLFSQHRLPCGPHTSSIGVAELGFPWYRSSHPQAASRKSPQLQIMTSSSVRYTVSQLSVVACSCWGTENSKMVPNQKNVEGDQPVQSQSCTAAIAATELCAEHCPGKTGLLESLHTFSIPFTKYFPELLIQCGFI